MRRSFPVRTVGCAAVVWMAIASVGLPLASADEIRLSTMGNCSIALIDRDNQLNPYDFGRNPAYLTDDFEESWIRFSTMLSEERGDLKRPYDPHLVNDYYSGFQGRKRLSGNQATAGYFRYERLWQRGEWHSLELDQYNDPFFLTDLTTGNFEYWGPVMAADYSLRLTPKVAIGAGFDYTISTGLKDTYTRPQVVHNYLRGNIGLLARPLNAWRLGLIVRPMRAQNRTNFDKADEGYDNIIYRYSGDGIYEMRSFSSYTLKEVMHGVEVGVQNFIETGRVQIGTIFSYGYADNSIRYNLTFPEEVGYWQDAYTDFRLLARYSPAIAPIVLGVSARVMDENGWAKRPKFEDVLLYDNPVKLRSIGGGASYAFGGTGLVLATEYVLNAFQIEADDYGANLFPKVDITQNIGRVGIEYNALNVYSIRGGVEVIDYPIDRWLKLPSNMTSYRFTGGFLYNWHLWTIEAEFGYQKYTKEGFDSERRDLSGILWFTHLEK